MERWTKSVSKPKWKVLVSLLTIGLLPNFLKGTLTTIKPYRCYSASGRCDNGAKHSTARIGDNEGLHAADLLYT